MKHLLVWLVLSLALCSQGTAAISTSTAWEVRPTVGVDTSGGCFVVGASGTDFSQQNAPQYNATDLVAVTNNTVSSVTHAFIASDVGNCMQITAGTGFTTGFYQIVSVLAGVATLDRAVGTAPLSGGTYAVGGALATIAKPLTANTAGNIIFVKATGTLAITADIVFNNNQAPTATVPPNQVVGYTTTRTDNGRATVQVTSGSGITMFNSSGVAGWYFRNFVLDCNSTAACNGVVVGFFSWVNNVKVTNYGAYGISAPGVQGSTVSDSEVTGGQTSCSGGIHWSNTNGGGVIRNYVHDSDCFGIDIREGGSALWNVAANLTGVTSDGIQTVTGADCAGCTIFQNTVYAVGRDGISIATTTAANSVQVRNNILVNSARYGIQGSTAAGWAAFSRYDGNFFFNNTTANRNNMDDTGTVNPINAAAPYTNTLDVSLSGNPFTNAAGGDFTLNNTAGAGAAVRGAGTPGAIPGQSGTGHIDGGAFQHLDSGGGGSAPAGGAFVQ